MRFESRELKPYAEPISASRLEEGVVYFSLNFVDEEMLVPVLEPVVFIGRNLEAGDTNLVYFQDIDSFRRGVRFGAAVDGSTEFYSGSETQVGHIFEYENALDVLLACSLRRKREYGAK